jgi:YVTN family beta-propeller protein
MKSKCCGRIAPVVGLLALWLTSADPVRPAASAGEAAQQYLGPCALAASHDGDTLYVACADARQVVWVELPGGKINRRVTLPAEPTGMVSTRDGKKLIVTCAAPRSTIAVLDAKSGRVLDTIPAGHTAATAVLNPDGTRLYVCNRFDNDVSVIDLTVGEEIQRIAADREPIAAAITPDGGHVWVANFLPNMRTNVSIIEEVSPVVTVIDTKTHETTAVYLPSGSNGLRGICISPDGGHAFVTHLLSNFQELPFRLETGWINTNVVSIIDTRRQKLVTTIGLDKLDSGAGNPWDVAFTADGKSICVSLAGTHELSVIDSSVLLSDHAHRTMSPMMGAWPIYTSLGESLWRRIKLPGNGPRGMATVGSQVYIAQYFTDSIAVVDLEAGDDDSVHSMPLGPTPKLTQQRFGELLFNDATICYQRWQSCASCHPDGRADALTWDLMNDGFGNTKNTKSMLLSHRTPPSMAEAVRPSAEVAVRSGIVNILFAQRPEAEAAAIDVYLKSLQPVPSPYLVEGRLTAAAERGRALFHSKRIGCQRCHPAPLYTDLKIHNVGTRTPNEYGERFDTPTLVEVWRTAPYLHDGRYTTIKQLLVEGRHGLQGKRGDSLSEREMDDLVEFVLSL